jgi:hypothetical protein
MLFIKYQHNKNILMSIYFPNIPATFIHVPRTGGTSFRKWVQKNIPNHIRLSEHNYATGSIENVSKTWPNLGTTFSFVRNPYSRLVSMYEYQYARAEILIKDYQPGSLREDSYLDHIRLIALSRKGFDYWIECICHDRPEVYNIYDGDPNQVSVNSWFSGSLPDIMIKTEELDTEFYKIQDLLTDGKCRDPLPRVNAIEHKPYQEYYTYDTKMMVAKKFRDDLDLFEYEF